MSESSTHHGQPRPFHNALHRPRNPLHQILAKLVKLGPRNFALEIHIVHQALHRHANLGIRRKDLLDFVGLSQELHHRALVFVNRPARARFRVELLCQKLLKTEIKLVASKSLVEPDALDLQLRDRLFRQPRVGRYILERDERCDRRSGAHVVENVVLGRGVVEVSGHCKV